MAFYIANVYMNDLIFLTEEKLEKRTPPVINLPIRKKSKGIKCIFIV